MAQLPRSRPPDLGTQRVRPARPSDRQAILEMWGALFRAHAELHPSYRAAENLEATLAATLTRELRDPSAIVLVATSEDAPDHPVGFCVARYAEIPASLREGARDREESLRGFVDELWVAAACRRRGTGRRLVVDALDALGRAGVTRVEVRVLHANEQAQGFWRALGFVSYVDVLEQRLQTL